MPKSPRLDTPADLLLPTSAVVLAQNVNALMAHSPEFASNPTLGKKAGLAPSAISRLRNGHNATLETIDKVAAVFGLQSWHLLLPGLDVQNPPVVQISAKEAELYRKLRELVKEDA